MCVRAPDPRLCVAMTPDHDQPLNLVVLLDVVDGREVSTEGLTVPLQKEGRRELLESKGEV